MTHRIITLRNFKKIICNSRFFRYEKIPSTDRIETTINTCHEFFIEDISLKQPSLSDTINIYVHRYQNNICRFVYVLQ